MHLFEIKYPAIKFIKKSNESIVSSKLRKTKFIRCNIDIIENFSVLEKCLFYKCNFNKCIFIDSNIETCFFYKCTFINSRARRMDIKDSIFELCRFDFSEGFIKLVNSESCTFFGAT